MEATVRVNHVWVALAISVIIPVWGAVFYMGRMDMKAENSASQLTRIEQTMNELKQEAKAAKDTQNQLELRVAELEWRTGVTGVVDAETFNYGGT